MTLGSEEGSWSVPSRRARSRSRVDGRCTFILSSALCLRKLVAPASCTVSSTPPVSRRSLTCSRATEGSEGREGCDLTNLSKCVKLFVRSPASSSLSSLRRRVSLCTSFLYFLVWLLRLRAMSAAASYMQALKASRIAKASSGHSLCATSRQRCSKVAV
jgi:hypothetical protein